MNFVVSNTVIALILGLLMLCWQQVFDNSTNQKNTSIQTQTLLASPQLMCNSEKSVFSKGKCVGSAYCTACKNCNYCGYCNSGGSCGVCRPRNRTRTNRKKSSSSSRSHSRSSTSSQTNKQNNYNYSSPKNTRTKGVFLITQKTSLRDQNNSKGRVLYRLSIGTQVELLDDSNRYWSKVIYEGSVGWVKKHLIVEKEKV